MPVLPEVIDAEGPGDTIDKYGRFVGNFIVGGVDINLEICGKAGPSWPSTIPCSAARWNLVCLPGKRVLMQETA